MDDVRRDVLDEIEAVLKRLSRAVRVDFEAAEAWLAWSAMATAVRSGSLGDADLERLGRRARRVSGLALAA
ncbi:MAG: hypothetical protein NT143_05520 [Actinobacteria bacterium]|nr:hypothetical protein [Actinomycetota bacterium]